jgi:type I restriction-modification system DNA methylase subunit
VFAPIFLWNKIIETLYNLKYKKAKVNSERENLEREIEGYNTPEKRKENDEVFTPPALINEMLGKLSNAVWSDPTKTWLDPCAGIGNFSVFVLERLMEGLKGWEPNEGIRKKHILENMLYHVEMNPESVAKLQKVLNPEGKYTLNVHCGDFLAFADSINSKKGKPLF